MVIAAGIDVGSSSIKVALVSIGSGVRTMAVRSAPTPSDADALRASACRLLSEVVAVGTPAAVGIASMAETGVPLGADGRALTPLVRWNAGRSDVEAAALMEKLGRHELFAATGVRPAPKVPLARWLWLRRTHPELDAWRWAGAADLVGLALTGVLATDHTLAGRTMAYRLPAPGAPLPTGFDPELLAAAGVSVDALPQVRRPTDPAVPALPIAGLVEGTPVVIAGHDHQVGAWAAGVRAPGSVADSLGTAESVIRVLAMRPDPAAVQDQGMSVVRTVSGTVDALVAGSSAAGAVIRWWLETFVPESLWARALAIPPADPAELVVTPYSSGRQSPEPDATASFSLRDRVGEVVDPAAVDPVVGTGAVLHALARQARWMGEVEDRLAGLAAGSVTVLGGSGPFTPAWQAAKAAVMSVPLTRVDVPEPVAAGAALLAAVRAGWVDDSVRFERVDVPAVNSDRRESGYRDFLRVVGSAGR